LSEQEALQVTAFVLLENSLVSGETKLSMDSLASIDLT